jgi:hypothetical protein
MFAQQRTIRLIKVSVIIAADLYIIAADLYIIAVHADRYGVKERGIG